MATMGKTRVVVVGGGFAGAHAARHMQRNPALDVELVDEKTYFVFQPLLPEVAGGAINVLDTLAPLRLMLRRCRVRHARVVGADFTAKTLRLVQGPMGDIVELPYDELVLAFGQSVDLSRFPGMREHAFTVKQAVDAFTLRNQILTCLERAELTHDRQMRRQLLTFVVVGGGFSGIEVLGEIHELAHRALRYFPGLHASELRFMLVEYQPRILPEVTPDLADYAAQVLARRGIEFLLGVGVKSQAATSLELSDGSLITTETVVATVGNGPSPLVGELGLPTERGKILVDGFLRVRDHDHVWAAGDAAQIPLSEGKFAPPTAQAAVQEAKLLAANIDAVVKGEALQSFSYRSKGSLASLGGRKAVAQVFGTKLSGTLAWMLWRLLYVGMIPEWTTRIRVAIDQMLDLVLPRAIVQAQATGGGASRFLHHRAGDLVLSAGQLGDGLHIVVSGSYVDDAGRSFRPGDHFGDDSILSGRPRRAAIHAREDSVCYVIGRQEFERLNQALQRAGAAAGRVPNVEARRLGEERPDARA